MYMWISLLLLLPIHVTVLSFCRVWIPVLFCLLRVSWHTPAVVGCQKAGPIWCTPLVSVRVHVSGRFLRVHVASEIGLRTDGGASPFPLWG